MLVELSMEQIARIIEMCQDMIKLERDGLRNGLDDKKDITETKRDIQFLLNLSDELRTQREEA